ncbi:2OG-Fe dioxygenase family protein [Caldibacillus thermoamylovorans]|uniref:2OG-Fe dioxygenase family protein n=1 Tax=Caldibacillus thermoamylovorans TaxID=35841 RepID=UPI002040E6B7|nr:2OG-Fe dioxygenase family protein [Caldibacillus thermoamylovorans]MCM3799636.1 2OG-Fe dioxygenase family protein [Caldibacillus thermoamylovorans]
MKKKNALGTLGFTRFQLSKEITDIDLNSTLAELRLEFENLPIDPYAKKLHRYRRYSRAVIIPGKQEIHWIPDVYNEAGEPMSEYFQGRFNPEYADEYRRFPSLSESAKSNKLLQQIIQFGFNQTFWNSRDILLPFQGKSIILESCITLKSKFFCFQPLISLD